ncbi:PEP-CTERM-box response regulator transcription factor [Azospirillum canadense]|uniref:PEP-CTERM-box response regulator transcription factor n=1 Tax=Azospirillum canadense TaxID=403962 RepID=UPI0022260AC2|nr:PEP-CTERM-box response regulator transcription factor [Azospirillum canadense]MCW2240936.1 two-component system NtrC family response regulator [Azospirillum canadense]
MTNSCDPTSAEPGVLLIVDDDPGIVTGLRWLFKPYRVVTAHCRAAALEMVERHKPAVVTLDLGLPPDPDGATEGLRTLEEILARAPETKVIMVSGNGDRANAIAAVGMGAYDFYQKPIESETLSLIVQRAFHVHRLEEENRALRAVSRSGLSGIVTASAAMRQACRTVEKVAPTDVNVLLLGESGTGKELFARATHELSRRTRKPFIALNCAAIPETLLESELFGHERGAFTGAVRQVKGKVELASGGTLFLDEIGDMPASIQAKLLRFLQDRRIERLGGRESIAVDVRVISATNRDLEAAIKQGQFREDLYFRLLGIGVHIPPLRERDDDPIVLANYFTERFCREQGRPRLRFTPDAVAALRRHAWPGNVRELENRMQRAVVLADGTGITAEDLGLAMAPTAESGPRTLRAARDAAERAALQDALLMARGNLSEAAKLLGISRPTIYSLLKEHGVDQADAEAPKDATRVTQGAAA